jgi:exopolyphosphatase/guanosine-5'-triphosphate,3'-diphosphate pyrophosphatase
MICGIVDLGSNTIRLSIYKYENGRTELMLSKKSVAGLLGYVTNGVLNAKGIAKACSVLNNFKDILTHFHIENAFIFATASLRNISNAEEVLKAIKAFTGYDVDVLSGEDEAKLDFYGALRATTLLSGLLVDIGGGSTELVRFHNDNILDAVSMPVGSLNLSLKHAPAIVPDDSGLKNIRQDVLGQLGRLELNGEKITDICGVGGTVRAARKIYNEMFDVPTDNMVMDTENLSQILSVYRKNSRKVLKKVIQLAPDRIHTVITGMVILATVSESFRASRIIVSTCGVREGYLQKKVLDGEKI